jgi:hypothetical protein
VTGRHKALVVFTGVGSHCLDRILKPGFKHCFCAVTDERGYWIVVNGRAGLPAVDVVAMADFDLKSFYEQEGLTVVQAPTGEAPRWPLTLTNCVGMVKSVLGINAFGVVTPWQLYRRLTWARSQISFPHLNHKL